MQRILFLGIILVMGLSGATYAQESIDEPHGLSPGCACPGHTLELLSPYYLPQVKAETNHDWIDKDFLWFADSPKQPSYSKAFS